MYPLLSGPLNKLKTLFLISCLVSVSGAAPKPKVGLVLDKGGRDDKSFNAAAFKGATEAEKKIPLQLKVVESSDDSSIEASLRTFARYNYDLIVGIGFAMADPIKKVAADFPKVKFLLVDSWVDAPNVRSVQFREQDGSFVVGAIAALTSKSKVIGFVGGMDVPLIRRFEMGYKAGAESVEPKVKVLTNYVGATSDAWRNPTRAKELANSQFEKKADVIFTAAGNSGLGVFDAAEEKKKFVIGVDSNQNWIKPGVVLTSMVKGVDKAVFAAIESYSKNTFQAGKFEMGFAEGGIEFAVDEHNRKVLTPAIEAKANSIKKDITSGKIKVPDYYTVSRKSATN